MYAAENSRFTLWNKHRGYSLKRVACRNSLIHKSRWSTRIKLCFFLRPKGKTDSKLKTLCIRTHAAIITDIFIVI